MTIKKSYFVNKSLQYNKVMVDHFTDNLGKKLCRYVDHLNQLKKM